MNLHARVALFFFVLLGLTLRLTWGLFHPFLLIVLTLAFVQFCWLSLRDQNDDSGVQFPTSAAALSTLIAFHAFLLWHGSINPNENPAGLVYPIEGEWLNAFRAEYGPLALLLAAAVLLWAVVIVWKRVPIWLFYRDHQLEQVIQFYLCVALALGLLCWQRFAVLNVSPDPQIDTIVVNSAACDYLRHGVNPYGLDAKYKDIYRSGYDYQAGFPYWPTYLYWTVPFRVFFHDIRYGSLVADLVTALFLWATARRIGIDFRTACLLPLVWLSFPVSLFVLEQAWIDPVLVMCVAALLWALVTRKWAIAGVTLGLVCGAKQYGVLVAMFTVIYLYRHERPHVLRVLTWMTIALAALFIPFLVLDARSFCRRTVEVYLNPTLRSDALSWPAAVKRFWQSEYSQRKGLYDRLAAMQPPNWFLPALYLALVGWGGARIWREKRPELKTWAAALAFSLGGIFLLGKIAFCNYYYFVAFLALVNLLLCLRPTTTSAPIVQSAVS